MTMPTANMQQETPEEVLYRGTVEILHAATKCDKTYVGKFKHYCRWVNGEREAGQIASDQSTYITRTNVDLYFNAVVVKFTTAPKTVHKSVVALQWFADDR
jgi:hypothetical protein